MMGHVDVATMLQRACRTLKDVGWRAHLAEKKREKEEEHANKFGRAPPKPAWQQAKK